MWAAYIIRFVRRKTVLGIIFSLSLTYCIVSFVYEPLHSNIIEPAPIKKMDENIIWYSSGDENNNTNTKVTTCRNSVQGKILIVDDKGYVCSRSEVLINNCCDTTTLNSKRYSCDTCKENGCCNVYEYCISCCLHPDKKALLQSVVGKAPETFRMVLASVADHYELCLAKCRTSSLSVQHENSYRDPRAKYCYGDTPPLPAPPASSNQRPL